MTINLTDEESAKMFRALRKGLWAIKQVGTDQEISDMLEAYEMFGNHETVSVGARALEPNGMSKSWNDDVARYGAE